MDMCPKCRESAAEVAALEAQLIANREEIRIVIEDRVAQGLDATAILDAMEEAGLEIGSLLTP